MSDELHRAEMRFTELSGRRTAIRERLEAEWRRPLEEMLDVLAFMEAADVSKAKGGAEVRLDELK